MITPAANEAIQDFLGYSGMIASGVPLETLKEKAAEIRTFINEKPDLFMSATGDDDDRGILHVESMGQTAISELDRQKLAMGLFLTTVAYANGHGEDPANQVAEIDQLMLMLGQLDSVLDDDLES